MPVGKKRAELVLKSTCKSVIAKAVGISPKHLHRISKLDQKDELLKQQIINVHKTHKAYGHRRVAWELNINHKRARRVMKKFNLKPPRRKSHCYTTRSVFNHNYTNLIKNITPSYPNHIWCSDVSYFKYQGKFWYLATIEDLFTRRIMSAQVGKFHNAKLILKTINQAFEKTDQLPQYFHTDQGTEFMAKICTKALEDKGIKVSVSAKASPWENGYKESFFGRFKDEFGDINRFDTDTELIEEIYSQVHYYNYERRHTAHKVSPMTFARSFA